MHDKMKVRKDYLRLSRNGKRFFFEGFIAQAVPISGRSGLVGITVTKKIGNSVQRNRAKRRLREVIRLWCKEFSAPLSFDIVLIARSKIFNVEFNKLRCQWCEMLKQLALNQDWIYEKDRC